MYMHVHMYMYIKSIKGSFRKKGILHVEQHKLIFYMVLHILYMHMRLDACSYKMHFEQCTTSPHFNSLHMYMYIHAYKYTLYCIHVFIIIHVWYYPFLTMISQHNITWTYMYVIWWTHSETHLFLLLYRYTYMYIHVNVCIYMFTHALHFITNGINTYPSLDMGEQFRMTLSEVGVPELNGFIDLHPGECALVWPRYLVKSIYIYTHICMHNNTWSHSYMYIHIRTVCVHGYTWYLILVVVTIIPMLEICSHYLKSVQ